MNLRWDPSVVSFDTGHPSRHQCGLCVQSICLWKTLTTSSQALGAVTVSTADDPYHHPFLLFGNFPYYVSVKGGGGGSCHCMGSQVYCSFVNKKCCAS
jgi:hypothetical protein